MNVNDVMYMLAYAMSCDDAEWKNKCMALAIKLLRKEENPVALIEAGFSKN